MMKQILIYTERVVLMGNEAVKEDNEKNGGGDEESQRNKETKQNKT